MENNDFDFSLFFKHLGDYFRACFKSLLLDAGASANRAIKIGVVTAVLFLFTPVLFLLLFTALGFGYATWFGVSYGLAFLFSALTALAMILLFLVWGIRLTRKKRELMLKKILHRVREMEGSFSVPPTPPEDFKTAGSCGVTSENNQDSRSVDL